MAERFHVIYSIIYNIDKAFSPGMKRINSFIRITQAPDDGAHKRYEYLKEICYFMTCSIVSYQDIPVPSTYINHFQDKIILRTSIQSLCYRK